LQNGTKAYPSIIEYPLNDVSIAEYSDIVFTVHGSGVEGYPLRANIVLYQENEKYAKSLGWVSEKWKKYTIPLSSFEGLQRDAQLLKMRIIIEQPRQLNTKYNVYIDDIELLGKKANKRNK